MRFVLLSAITALAVWLVTFLPLGVVVDGGETGTWARIGVFLLVGAVMTAANLLIKPIVDVLTLPVKILTLGLFSLVVAWFMLWLTSWLSTLVPWAELTIGGFWETVLAALVISIITAILSAIVPGARRD
ncbi:phage holin family protein [Demequina sp. SYSU T00039]|uniref:Phage holin family protein n=1 Tax=Demequina lignilytica TaxID=3051663 RepID=A0AAW7M2C6_9MICO|nr:MULTISPECIES: phage holin family protein [unclassified Demequina]MDN4477870.1 phage holin family protein [Demequina sp. SYSU T00039-1]MDN4487779.1 phage holin family protein [Demequina sp. SYSU T00039]MDN4490838.1 phage holin family protein [Demequina sp. SYSU T00068]